ncbi:hypothetical protein QBC42DRAFT_268938 [Cladorrhinum samala]|uniref:Uncharacterized protein n=1 Tax=Cladorrhinum samala TaxID=585594 RepID=A0AAV9HMM3_9PEZI|nr:hypothetical protein QBC42DRAFT_268938 [Cladorrhinum samala]
MIIQFPEGGPFYILKCDEHGVHFGEHPLRGAAKHLASAQHGRMSKEHSKAVETLGHRVIDCNVQLMEMNNAKVMDAFGQGYKPFNANQLSKTKRALKGFPNLDKPATPAASPSGTPLKQRRPPAPVIWNPTIPGLYVGFLAPDQKHYPVILLPWDRPNLECVGLGSTFADLGLLDAPEKLPKCYVYKREGDNITGIEGWAEGFEDGGPLAKRREFAVIYIDNESPNRWQIGWIQAKHLSHFELEKPEPEDLPFFSVAREYYAQAIRGFESYEALRQSRFAARQSDVMQDTAAVTGPENDAGQSDRSGQGFDSAPRHPLPSRSRDEDSEMLDAGGSDVESDRASSAKSSRNSDDDVEMAGTDSRRTSVSNREDTPKESSSTPGPLAQAIAAQALSLQGPARPSGFTAINSRSGASSAEPASRQGSVERKRVEKIYASSRRQNQETLASSAALSDRPTKDVVSSQAPSPSPDLSAARRPSPASLQHILQDSPSESRDAPAAGSEHRNQPAPARATSTPVISPQPSGSTSGATGLGISIGDADSVERAKSTPAQTDVEKVSEEKERPQDTSATRDAASTPPTTALGINGLARLNPLPTVQPLLSQYPTPLPSATESTQSRTPLPAMSFSRPSEVTPAASPLGTPTASALNSRSTSPAVGSFVLAKSEGAPLAAQAPGVSPEKTVFQVCMRHGGESEGSSGVDSGSAFQLVEDDKSGVFKAVDGSPDSAASFELDPQEVEKAIRMPSETGATCLVKVIFNKVGEDKGKGKQIELWFETIKNSKRGTVTGKVLATQFCRRLRAWNNDVDCPRA